jgi:hypothetical protein
MSEEPETEFDVLWTECHSALHIMRSFAAHLMEMSARLENAMVDFNNADWPQNLMGAGWPNENPVDQHNRIKGDDNVVPFPTGQE